MVVHFILDKKWSITSHQILHSMLIHSMLISTTFVHLPVYKAQWTVGRLGKLIGQWYKSDGLYAYTPLDIVYSWLVPRITSRVHVHVYQRYSSYR